MADIILCEPQDSPAPLGYVIVEDHPREGTRVYPTLHPTRAGAQAGADELRALAASPHAAGRHAGVVFEVAAVTVEHVTSGARVGRAFTE